MNYKNISIQLALFVLYFMSATSAMERLGFWGVIFAGVLYLIALFKSDNEARGKP